MWFLTIYGKQLSVKKIDVSKELSVRAEINLQKFTLLSVELKNPWIFG